MRQHAGHRTHAPVETELPHCRARLDDGGLGLTCRSQYPERDGQVEPGTVLAQRAGSKIHDHPRVGHVEPAGPERRADALARLLYRRVREPHDREGRQSRSDIDFHIDGKRFDASEGERLRDRVR